MKCFKSFFSYLFRFFICSILSCLLISAVYFLYGGLKNADFKFEVQGLKNSTVTIFYSGNSVFDKLNFYQITITEENKLIPFSFSIPLNKAKHIRIQFSQSNGDVFLKGVTLNGLSLNINRAFKYEKRNIRSCEKDSPEPGVHHCMLAGENGYITFEPEEINNILFSDGIRKILICLSLILFLILWLLYGKIFHIVLMAASKNKLFCALISVPVLYELLKIFCYWDIASAGYKSYGAIEFLKIIKADIIIPAILIIFCLYISYFKKVWIKTAFSVMAFIITFIQLLDFGLIQSLNSRLIFSQSIEFALEWRATWSIAKEYLLSLYGILSLLFLVNLSAAVFYSWRTNIKNRKIISVIFLSSVLVYVLPYPKINEKYQDLAHLYWGVYNQNKNNNTAAESGEFVPKYHCEEGLNGRQNIIIIVLESFSSYLSKYFSGLNDYMPSLDKLAKENMAFMNYHTNSYNTVQSMFGLLTGWPMLQKGPSAATLRTDKFYTYNLTKPFQDEGYNTAFFSSASFVYSKDDIVKRLKFRTLSNDSDPFYDGKERFAFNSVSDDHLYERFKMWLKETPEEPYLAVIETTTSHFPYTHPISKETTLEGTIEYADKYMGLFVEYLKEEKFFENNGVLVITGDHRAMRLIKPEEYEVLGPMADSMVPMVIMGKGFKGVDRDKAAHTDLGASLAYLALPKACFNQYQRNIFKPENPRKTCALFQRHPFPHNVLIDCGGRISKICLLSHTSRACGGELPVSEEYLSYIKWLRLETLEEPATEMPPEEKERFLNLIKENKKDTL